MRVALNGTSLLSPLTGIGQYTYHLATEVQKREDIELELFYGSGWADHLTPTPPRSATTIKALVKKLLPDSRRLARVAQQMKFNSGVRGKAFDVYHEPNFLAFDFEGPSVITVHDLSWIRFPHTHPAARVEAMNRYFVPGLKRASLLLTDSEFVKREIVEEFQIDPEKIRPIMLGVDEQFHPMDAEETRIALQTHGLVHGKYLIAVGTLEPRKNLGVALKAFMQLPEQLRQQYPLVLVGIKGWRTSELESQMAPLIHAGHIRQLGYVSREDLACVMAGARALIYPSIYEGFGLPPLEAMACAVPVIASNVSSLPEVVGDTGILIDPMDVEGITRAMQLLICDQETRDSMSAVALLRSKSFTWSKCAEETLTAYRIAIDAGTR